MQTNANKTCGGSSSSSTIIGDNNSHIEFYVNSFLYDIDICEFLQQHERLKVELNRAIQQIRIKDELLKQFIKRFKK